MSTQAIPQTDPDEQFRRGVMGAVALHVLLALIFIAFGFYLNHNSNHWGENASAAGSIQASMVSAIPLPEKAKPVEKSVLTPDTVSPAPLRVSTRIVSFIIPHVGWRNGAGNRPIVARGETERARLCRALRQDGSRPRLLPRRSASAAAPASPGIVSD